MEDRIFELAAALNHGAEQDQEILRLLCGQALRELEGRLRPGITAADCADALVVAGAWLALAGMSASQNTVERFTAGDLTIQHGDAAARGEALRLQAEQIMRPYLVDSGFAFRGVRS